MEPQFIDKQSLVHWLEEAKGHSLDPVAGLYGPGSMMWRVWSHMVTFAGAGTANLLQLAHPWIANSIDQHSKTETDPLGRFQRTFTNVWTMIYGDLDKVTESALRVHHIHTAIKGKVAESKGAYEEGSYYQANEAHAMFWVHATLMDTAFKFYELFVHRLSKVERDQYYEESKLFALLFGIDKELIPETWEDFQQYMNDMYESDLLVVGDVGYKVGNMVLNLSVPHIPRLFTDPLLNWVRFVTSETMHPRLVADFGLDPSTPETQRKLRKQAKISRRMQKHLPAHVRYNPTYIEAMRRIKGYHNADWATRQISKALVGKAELVSA